MGENCLFIIIILLQTTTYEACTSPGHRDAEICLVVMNGNLLVLFDHVVGWGRDFLNLQICLMLSRGNVPSWLFPLFWPKGRQTPR